MNQLYKLGISVTHYAGTSRLKYFVFGLISLADSIVLVLSLGMLTPQWRALALFSDWFENEKER